MVDEITPSGLPELGIVEAKTANFGGHPPEFLKLCTASSSSFLKLVVSVDDIAMSISFL